MINRFLACPTYTSSSSFLLSSIMSTVIVLRDFAINDDVLIWDLVILVYWGGKQLDLDLANRSFGSGTGRVKFGLGHIWVKWDFGSFQFGSGMVRFGSISDQSIFGQIRLSCQNKQLCRKFGVGYSLVRVNSGFGSTFGWAYFGCRVGYGPGSFDSNFGSRVSFTRSTWDQLPHYLDRKSVV